MMDAKEKIKCGCCGKIIEDIYYEILVCRWQRSQHYGQDTRHERLCVKCFIGKRRKLHLKKTKHAILENSDRKIIQKLKKARRK